MKVFALTFAYNESFFLPRWADYFGRQLGRENLYVLDHGSTDGCCEGLGDVNIVRVPRSAFDDIKKATFATHFHRALLNYFDAGYVTDADEFVVADPAKYENLADYAERSAVGAPTCIGLELFHVRSLEPDFVESVPILQQRKHVIFDSWMCKRSFGRIPMVFGGGFHTSNQPVVFDRDLYLIHAKNFNMTHRQARQIVTAQWDYAGSFGVHAKQSPEHVTGLFDAVEARVRDGNITTDFDFTAEAELCCERTIMNPSSEYDFNLHGGFQGTKVQILPERFRHAF